MNTSASTAHTTTATAGHAPAQGTAAGSRTPGARPAAGGDLFAQLLLLMGAGADAARDPLASGSDATALATSDTEPGVIKDDGLPPQDNPLLGLLSWSGVPLPTSGPQGTAGTDGPSRAIAGTVGGTGGTGSLGAGALPGGAAPGTLPADLPALRTPESLDADTRMALGLGSPGADAAANPARADSRALPGAGNGARAPLGAQVFAWRSTTTLAHAAGAQTVASPAASATTASAALAVAADRAHAATSPAEAMRAGHLQGQTGPASVRDSESDGETDTLSGLGSASGRTLVRGDGAGGMAPDAGATASGLGDGSGTGERDPGQASGQDRHEASETGHPPHGGSADADDSASVPWGAQHLRHASVRVGDAGEATIDIQLSMAGQELQVAFRTNDEAARDQLAQDAGAALGDLLARSGIELGGVSVGGQGTQGGHDHPGRAPLAPPAPRSDATAARLQTPDAAPRTAAPAAQPPRANGSQPLDLFV